MVFFFSFYACGKPITEASIPKVHVSNQISYQEARTYLFGKLHYNKGIVTDVYCGEDHKNNHGVGEGRIPDPKFLNCEHTWPQSKFKGKSQAAQMKVDLHHLYPANSSANSARSNLPFGEVSKGINVCGESYKGKIDGTRIEGFEPPDNHKGNVARAMFYFSYKYSMPIDSLQESFLRKWHDQDPVDEYEAFRNDQIKAIQGDRNIFIDNPELVHTVNDF